MARPHWPHIGRHPFPALVPGTKPPTASLRASGSLSGSTFAQHSSGCCPTRISMLPTRCVCSHPHSTPKEMGDTNPHTSHMEEIEGACSMRPQATHRPEDGAQGSAFLIPSRVSRHHGRCHVAQLGVQGPPPCTPFFLERGSEPSQAACCLAGPQMQAYQLRPPKPTQTVQSMNMHVDLHP